MQAVCSTSRAISSAALSIRNRDKSCKKWNARLEKALAIVATLVNYDALYLGGGNATRIDFKLSPNVKLAANVNGITGGIQLWNPMLDEFFEPLSGMVSCAEDKRSRNL